MDFRGRWRPSPTSDQSDQCHRRPLTNSWDIVGYINTHLVFISPVWSGVQHYLQYCIRAQRILRSACAYVQVNQSFHCIPKDALVPLLSTVPCVDSDQTVWMRSLIWVFAGRTCNLVGSAVPRLISFRNEGTQGSAWFDFVVSLRFSTF